MADPTLDFSERLSRKVLASLRSLNASLGEVRLSVSKIDSIAHARLSLSSAGSPGKAGVDEPFSAALRPPRDAVASSGAGLDAPVLKQLLLSPGLRGAGLDEGVLSELKRVLDPETLAAVRRHVEPKAGGRGSGKDTRAAPPGAAARRRGGLPSSEGGGCSSDEDAAGAAAPPGGAPADGEDASEDQTLAQARRYRQRSARTGRQPADDDEDSDASADFGEGATAAGRVSAAVPHHVTAAPPPLPGGAAGRGGVGATAAALAMNQRQRIDAFQSASPPPATAGADAAAPDSRAPVVYSFPRYVDPPAETLEDDGEDDDVPVHVTELQEVSRGIQ